MKSKKILDEYRKIPYFYKKYANRYNAYTLKNPHLSMEDVITYVNIGLDKPYYTDILVVDDYSTTLLVNKYRSLPSNFEPNNMALIPDVFTTREAYKDFRLQKPACEAFIKMCNDAMKGKIKLFALSATRSYDYQYHNYWQNAPEVMNLKQKREYIKETDKYKARPSHSEHHTGLAVDINSVDDDFENSKESKWLLANAFNYGFILRYPKGKEHITGYSYEPWHYRYIGEALSKKVIKSGLTYDEYYMRYLDLKLIDNNKLKTKQNFFC